LTALSQAIAKLLGTSASRRDPGGRSGVVVRVAPKTAQHSPFPQPCAWSLCSQNAVPMPDSAGLSSIEHKDVQCLTVIL
uniref:Uncharacterized protein n=1 Tax=Prolemur simus TaxID=1328070 RepID=A0A8C8Z2U6_PROSS